MPAMHHGAQREGGYELLRAKATIKDCGAPASCINRKTAALQAHRARRQPSRAPPCGRGYRANMASSDTCGMHFAGHSGRLILAPTFSFMRLASLRARKQDVAP
jgi:hypothetical protein